MAGKIHACLDSNKIHLSTGRSEWNNNKGCNSNLRTVSGMQTALSFDNDGHGTNPFENTTGYGSCIFLHAQQREVQNNMTMRMRNFAELFEQFLLQ